MNTAALPLLALGFLLCLGGLALALRRALFLRRSRRTLGRVVALEHDSADFPIVTFSPDGETLHAGGRTVTFRSDSNSNTLTPGATVPVCFDPQEPQRAFIASFGQLWAVPLMLSLFGLALVAFGLLLGLGA